MKDTENFNEKAWGVLQKKAFGFDTEETVEEYVADTDTGEVKLAKKKITTKSVPPDLTALKLIMDEENSDSLVKNMTDEELEREKERLIRLLEKA